MIKTTGKDGKVKETKIEKSFTDWFDAAGRFVALPFQQMFASNVEVIGKADPKRIVTKKEKIKAPVDNGKSMDEKWASLLAESSGVNTATVEAESMATPGKGTKRRGRKA